jgi:hypothetical protein
LPDHFPGDCDVWPAGIGGAAPGFSKGDYPWIACADDQVNLDRPGLRALYSPSNYEQDKSTKYPALYILDGQWDFKLMDFVLGGLVYDKFAPQMILVGVTTPEITRTTTACG